MIVPNPYPTEHGDFVHQCDAGEACGDKLAVATVKGSGQWRLDCYEYTFSCTYCPYCGEKLEPV